MRLDDFYRKDRAKYIAIVQKRQRCKYADAEDIVQEAFLRAAKGFHNYDPAKGKLKSWFSVILRNAMIDYRRKLQKEYENFLEENIDYELDEEIFDIVDNKVHKSILIKHFSEGLTKSEIAHELNLKSETVRKIINSFLRKVSQ